jgi:hypothetical protein
MIEAIPTSWLTFARKLSRGRGIQTFHSGLEALRPGPIDASCIEEGEPVARCTTFTVSPDKRLSSGLWECTAGKFRVEFFLDEVVHILEGAVTVREEDGAAKTLGPGDAAYFPLGLVTHWDVACFVKKLFVVRLPGGNSRIARARLRLGL